MLGFALRHHFLQYLERVVCGSDNPFQLLNKVTKQISVYVSTDVLVQWMIICISVKQNWNQDRALWESVASYAPCVNQGNGPVTS